MNANEERLYPAVRVMYRQRLNQHYRVREPGAQAEGHARCVRDGAQVWQGTHLETGSITLYRRHARGLS